MNWYIFIRFFDKKLIEYYEGKNDPIKLYFLDWLKTLLIKFSVEPETSNSLLKNSANLNAEKNLTDDQLFNTMERENFSYDQYQ